jgi:hypothetical protein
MATWSEVEAHVAAHFRLARKEPTWFALLWDFGKPDDPLRQEVRVEQIEAFGEPWLLLVSRVCAEPLLDAKEILARNARLAIGSVALVRGTYIVRHPLRLSTLAWDELDRALLFVAREACALMGDLTRTTEWPGEVAP